MLPVLAGFAGHIPDALVRAFPNATVTQSSDWNGFNATYSDDWLLQPQDPLFAALGKAYYTALVETYGLNPDGAPNYYNAGACVADGCGLESCGPYTRIRELAAAGDELLPFPHVDGLWAVSPAPASNS